MSLPPDQRQHLLRSPRLGPGVVRRLEQVGVTSLDELRGERLDAVLEAICQQDGSPAWHGRRRPLQRALASYAG